MVCCCCGEYDGGRDDDDDDDVKSKGEVRMGDLLLRLVVGEETVGGGNIAKG